MGQKGSRTVVYAAPDLSASQRQYADVPMLKKAGSLSTLGAHSSRLTGKKERTGTLRRTRSFTEHQEEEEKRRKVAERVEKEAREMNEWVREPHKTNNNPPALQDLAALVIANSLSSTMDIERLQCSRELKDHIEFMLAPVFDESVANNSVSFSNSGRTILYNGKSYSTTTMKTPKDCGLSRHRCAWIMYIENSRVQGWMQLGVVDRERWATKCKTVWDGDPHPFRKGEIARRNNGSFHSGRHSYEATMLHEGIYIGSYTKGDTIGIKVDFETKEIHWTKNGEDYGKPVKFNGEAIWPSVSLDSPGEAVSLLYYTCWLRMSYFQGQVHHHTTVHTQDHM